MTERPQSASGLFAGIVGLTVGTVVAFGTVALAIEPYQKTLIVGATSAFSMILVELVWSKVHRNSSTGLATQPVNPWNWARITQKLIAFWTIIAIMMAVYFWLIPEYSTDFYDPFRQAALFFLPYLAISSPFYVTYVDRRQHEPNDAYVQFFMLLTGQRPVDIKQLSLLAKGWLVKAFFLPVMFVFLTANIRDVEVSTFNNGFASFSNFYDMAYDLFYMWDVIPALVGYTLTLRLIDSHIRSVEPTLFGWFICLVCYPPFWSAVTWNYFAYNADELYWADFVRDIPILYVVWGSAILALLVIYVWGTAMFGTRFSNLTHRGILTGGPFRWFKHPAYLSKNLTWWLISVPFLTTGNWPQAIQSCLLLGGVNTIYYLRAKTEERHLSADPVYQRYLEYMSEHGVFARIRRSLFDRRATKVTPSEHRPFPE